MGQKVGMAVQVSKLIHLVFKQDFDIFVLISFDLADNFMVVDNVEISVLEIYGKHKGCFIA